MTDNHFTIIVPTRERTDTLRYTIQTILNQTYKNYTVLISDNFSQDGTRDIIDSFTDERIKYINTGKRVSMSHNWEFALAHVERGWVTILGDDDGLLPNSLMKKMGWKTGDTIDWHDNKDGTWSLLKVATPSKSKKNKI